ncbi:MAG: hypothetical protein KKE20_02340 [Nanoarchaeota archaeon]|nr:hypothetical protein [Nanoarchaeota archaeon]
MENKDNLNDNGYKTLEGALQNGNLLHKGMYLMKQGFDLYKTNLKETFNERLLEAMCTSYEGLPEYCMEMER